MSDEHPFRGPEGRLHFPRWSKDCWRGRPAGCCWLCWVRLAIAPVRYRLQTKDDET